PQISKDELTLAQTLMEIKAAKPKAKGVTIQEPSEFQTTSPPQPSQPPHAKEKGKGIMVEPKKPLKKKDQIALNEEDRLQLNELMDICTKLSDRVLSLEQTKTIQAAKIKKLKKKVKKLKGKKKKKKKKKRIHGLGAQEDASKQGRIVKIDANEDLFLIDETTQDQERIKDQDLLRVHDLDGDEVLVELQLVRM
nr:hypothetical protein [Tanacetum cinerariifolium]